MKEEKYILSFYGDDFTGSTDVMETLALNGMPAALFLDAPTKEEVQSFQLKNKVGGDQLEAFGVAGIARSLTPDAMMMELNPIFKALSEIPVQFFQYKVCSTLDSSPDIGNIGIATDIALQYFPSAKVPLVIGAPFLNRFVTFSNLFARLENNVYRIDRHPVMSRHPVTPMNEGDIRQHLGAQTKRAFETYDLLQLRSKADFSLKTDPSIDTPYLLFDTIEDQDLVTIAKMLWEARNNTPQLLIGSSGISYGLARHLRSNEKEVVPETPRISARSQILVAAGSCSPVTERQLRFAMTKGMQGIRIDTLKLLQNRVNEIERVFLEALQKLKDGKSPLIYTALGPDDTGIVHLKSQSNQMRNTLLGESIGEIVSRILSIYPPLRTVIVGGDTSGYVSRYLKIYALETMAPVAPGAPLCVAHAKDKRFDGREIALKGGQNGKDDYFQRILGR
ncbi:MAG: four-carbon acid sugar kinase family protein [Saprospiraceae bacterium]|nr:four-carbon acid sugar kinase family protein [Saprospiraceae bacterium]